MSTEPKPDLSVFDEPDPHPERAIKPDPKQREMQKELDKQLKQTFPASDQPSISQATRIGPKKKSKRVSKAA